MNENDLKQLNLTGNLQALDSLPVVTPETGDAYKFLSQYLGAVISSGAIQNGAVGSNQLGVTPSANSRAVGTSTAQYGGNIVSSWGNVSTVGTGEQDLRIHHLGTGVLTANGQYLQYETSFQTDDTSGTEVMKIYLGTAVLFNGTQSGGDASIIVRLKVGRVGTGSQYYRLETGNINFGTLDLNSLGSLTLRFTGQGFGDGTITSNYSIVSWWPA